MNIKRLIIVVNFVLVLIAGYLIFDLTVSVLRRDYPTELEVLAIPIDATSQKQKDYPFKRYQVIEKRDIFASNVGILPVSQYEPKEEALNLPKTSLRLRLKGTIIKGEVAFAIIENLKTRKEELYRLGALIEGAKIVAIYKKSVVLERNGKREALEIVDKDKVVDLRRRPEPQRIEVARATFEPLNAQVISTGDIQYIKENTNELLSQVRIIPYFSKGVSGGYKLGNIKKGSLIEKYGFKDGDVLKSVNGISLSSPDKVLEAYQAAQNAGSVEITVERDGGPVTFTYKIGSPR